MIGIEIFAGAGGMSLGAANAGIDVRVAIEINKAACATFSENHKGVKVINSDVSQVHAIDYGGRSAPVVLFGGPPCQGFSTSNQKTRNRENQNNWLFREFFRIADMIKPDWIVLENVAGILQTDKGSFLHHIVDELKVRGYMFSFELLQAEEHGIPQRRKRFFLIAGKERGFKPLDQVARCTQEITVKDAIADLPPLLNGDAYGELPYAKVAESNYAKSLRGKLLKCDGHIVTKNAEHIVERYRHIPEGGNWRDIPEHLMTSYKDRTRCHTGIYHRLSDDRSSIVLGNFRKNMLIHPKQNRGLSVREAARIQSFPDAYRFLGSIGLQQQQVGNAVPPKLAQVVFSHLVSEITQ